MRRAYRFGVVVFEIGQDSITVQFDSGMKYLYTAQIAGEARIADMRRARAGDGLKSLVQLGSREFGPVI
ncbi:hypothetical protein C7A17_17785 [Ectopseudomonas mendocina]|uniref:Uncharacterized protein n=1 Tax=Ectopseudomonas mendocina TaxID=300 RepID=A0A2R3QX42_ECTME|nr:hypothetical protein C7A17_17785 [Pseudomonas mendocina]